MALTDAYFTIEEFRAHLGISQVLEGETGVLVDAANAACRQVDRFCGRVFTTDANASARIFAGWSTTSRLVDDIHYATGVTVELSDDRSTWTTLSSTYWFLGPSTAEVASAEAEPYYIIDSTYGAPFTSKWMKVTAKWGWAAVPEAVRHASLIQAAHIYKRRDSITGLEFLPDAGSARVPMGLDRDAALLLGTYRRADRVIGVA
jgi:hypothetical protein